MADLPRVALFVTGGTIDSLGRHRLDLAWYTEAETRIDIGHLLARIPELQEIARVEPVPFSRLSSSAVSPQDWLRLHAAVEEALRDEGVQGVVITHGTNTIEETAYFLNLTLKTEKPVVVVGAMRPASGLSTDADLNLLNAVRVAASQAAIGKGVLVVLNDAIHAAREVTKTATYRVQTFESRDAGPLGYADADGRVIFYRAPTRKHTLEAPFNVRGRADLPRVEIALSYAGQGDWLIDAAVAAGAEGIVSAGTGAGRCTPAENQALDRAHQRGVVVVQGTRVGSGRVVASPRLKQRGLVAADNLNPYKARILLMLALTVTKDQGEIQEMFERF